MSFTHAFCSFSWALACPKMIRRLPCALQVNLPAKVLMAHFLRLLGLSLLLLGFLLLGTSSISHASEVNKNAEDIEKITVFHAKDARIKQKLTTDNSYLNPQKLVFSHTSVSDILLSNPGSHLNGQGGLFQSYNIRGFSRNRIKTEVDGIPIITDRRAGNALSFIPAELINGVNIQKGPSATLYGTGAMGGVVSVSTYNDDTSEIGLLVQPQDNNKQLHLKHADDNWSIAALHRSAANAKAANGEPLKSEYEQSFITLAKQAQWNDIDVYMSLMANDGRDLGKSSATYPEERISFYPKDQHLLAQIEFTHESDWSLKFYHHDQNWQSTTIRLDDDQEVSRTNTSDYQSDTWGSYGQYQYDKTRIGIEWLGRRNIKISEQEFDAFDEFQWDHLSVNAQEDNLSAFIFQQFDYKKLQVEAGIRFDWMQVEQLSQTKNDQYVSYSLNTTYPFNNNTVLHTEVATAFRFPSVSELFYEGETPRGNTQGNDGLTPEESIGYQLSVKHQLTPAFSLALHTYYYDIDDYIERYTMTNSDDSADDITSYRNTDKVTIKGLELTSLWKISHRLSSQLGLQLQSGKDENNDAIGDSLPNAIKWSLYWQPHWFEQNLTLKNNMLYQFSKSHVGPSEKAFNEELVWNMSLSIAPTNEQTLTLSLLNVTDNTYQASADEDAPLQPERSWNIKWIYSF